MAVPDRHRPSRQREGAAELLGRRRECDVLDRLLDAVRGGEGRTLVVRGQPGVGKTALLDYLAEQASGCRVAHAAGVESEMELRLRRAAPAADADAGPPGTAPGSTGQRVADGVRPPLRVGAGPVPGRAGHPQPAGRGGRGAPTGLPGRRRAVAGSGLGPGPWVRGPSPGRGVGRRGVRGPGSGRRAGGVARAGGRGPARRPMRVPCWTRCSPGRWIRGSTTGSWPRPRGNPLALVELPRGVTPAELAGGFALPDAMPLSGRIEESFRRRLEVLPDDTRVLVAAGGGRSGRRPGADVAGGRAARYRHPRRRLRRPRPAWWSSAPGCGSGIPWCGRRPTGRRRSRSGKRCIAPWPRPPTRSLIPTVGPGTGPRPRPDPTRTSPPSWSARPAAPRRAGAWPRRPRSCSASVALTVDPARRAERALAAAQASLQAGSFDAALGLVATAEGRSAG